MLDPSLIAQLKDLYSGLQADYTLRLCPSSASSQGELRSFLEDIASTSEKIRVLEDGERSESVRFELLKDGMPTGIEFRGIPGGHELTSLVLSILNADGKGKLPDEAVQRRVRALRGPIALRTYVSLSCTNCPDVVQALNQMALIHGQLRHEMVDGALAAREIESLGVQAVPSVYSGDTLLHVGRGSFEELVEVLEGHFGRREERNESGAAAPRVRDFDVVVVGGGPAGCSAAIYSARKGLKTALVSQAIGGQVRETLGIENLVSVPRTEGARLAANLEAHVRSYSVELLEHRRVEEIRSSPKVQRGPPQGRRGAPYARGHRRDRRPLARARHSG